jgi:diguanylate cyclase (GGDEF)-like protein
MSIPFEAAWAAAALLPGLAALSGRPEAALTAAAVSGALAAGSPWASAWSALACGLVWLAQRRMATRAAVATEALAGTRKQRGDASHELSQAKALGNLAERENKETLVLYGMIKGLAESLTWEDVKPKLDAAVVQYFGMSEFTLFVRAIEGESFQYLTGRGGKTWAVVERALQEQGLESGEAHLLHRPEAAVALPIRDGGEVLGYFYGKLPASADGQHVLAKASTFAAELAFAFRRVRLYQEMERLSQIDGLTGVHRRGAFDERIREEVVRAKTFRTTFGLMILDIDHFKRLNDRYGHPFGDQVLKRVGELLNGAVYETDFVARYGGEEFVIVLPRAEPEGALRKAEAIRRLIEAERFSLAFETIRVTVSIGLAHFPRDAGSPEELVARADSMLYRAKSQGRNQVVA